MPSFGVKRADGRIRIQARGCCSVDEHRREYERAYMEQVLADGGRIVARDGSRVDLVDRKGRPRSVDLS